MRIAIMALSALALSATAGAATTFRVFAAGTTGLLGTFDAPAGGGLLTAAAFAVDGGLYDVLATGTGAPDYDATNNWVTAAGGGGFGAVFNSVAYNTTDFFSNPITCGVGDCVFSMTDSGGGGVPAEWYLDYLPGDGGDAPIDLGYYEVAPIPLPGAGLLLAGALAGFLGLRRRAV